VGKKFFYCCYSFAVVCVCVCLSLGSTLPHRGLNYIHVYKFTSSGATSRTGYWGYSNNAGMRSLESTDDSLVYYRLCVRLH
jgi:hypothetical protein